MIPITIPFLGEEESKAVDEVIRSGWITQGPKTREFEEAFASYCGAEHAVAVSNCTAALHLALLVHGIGPGDEVLCPSMSFIATANAIRMCGATPVFVEVDKRTFNLDAGRLEECISGKTRAILAVHQIGLPADMPAIMEVARRNALVVIEDAACAIGSRWDGRPIGAGFGNCVCFSFHPRKVISTGEGGMITLDDGEIAEQLRLLRHQGMALSDLQRHGASTVVIEKYPIRGYNYRMTDIQAAIGIEQLKKLDDIVARRRALAEVYNVAFRDHPWLDPPYAPDAAVHNYQSYAVTLNSDAPCSRNELMQRLLDAGISSRRGIMLAHREAAHADLNWTDDDLPDSVAASDYSVLLPLFPQMTDEQQRHVIAVLKDG